jgi:lipopolysaccharide export system permease protein
MRILDKYILKEFLGPFIFGVCAFTSVFVGTGTLYRIASLINEYGASMWAAFRVFVLALPSIIVMTFPMSVLLGALLAFGRLSSSSEMIVMRAGGQNFFRLALPIFITAVFISLGTTAFNEFVVPKANGAYNTIINDEIKHHAQPQTQNHIVIKNVSGPSISSLMYARTFDGNTKQLQTITLEEFENDVLKRVENADHAIWDGNKWVMQDGVIYDFDDKGEVARTMRFKSQTMPVQQKPKDINKSQRKPDELTIKELREQIRILDDNAVNTNKMKVELYNRFALPLASLVCAIIGAPLGMQKQRGSSSIGFGISVIVIFIYYTIMTLGGALGNSGKVPAVLGAFLPDIVCGITGVILVYRASR